MSTKKTEAAEASDVSKTDADETAKDGGDETAASNVEPIFPDLDDPALELAHIHDRIGELETERDELKDKLLRALAESENIRRRAERDRRDAENYGGTRLARDLLSVHDNLARAMDAADEALKKDHGAFLEGVELTQRELLNAFEKHKIRKVTPEIGEKFDPNRHQAMFEAPIPGAPPGTVIDVMQAGFVIADRLLRPALVGVAKAAPGAKPSESDAKAKAEAGAENGAEPSAKDGSDEKPED